MIGVIFISLICIGFTSAEEPSKSPLRIGTSPEHHVLQADTQTTLPCTVVGDGYSMWKNTIEWYKVTVGENGDEEQIPINANAIVKEPFEATGRYSISPEVEDGEVKVALTMNITLAENGTYKCVLRDSKHILGEVVHTLLIPVAIDDLIMSTNHSRAVVEGNDTKTFFDFEKLKPAFLSCVSKGGNPMPSLKMYRGRTEVTSDFDQSVVETRVGPKGLEEVRYEIQLVKPDFMAGSEYSGHNLKCVSKVPKAGKGDKLQVHKHTKVATMEVTYPPEFECTRDWSAFLATEQFAMECSVHANPQVELDTIYWAIGEDAENSTQIAVGKAVDGISANITVDRMTDKVKVSLTFDQINSTHLDQHYILRVKNDLGVRHFSTVLSLATTTLSTSTTTAKPTVRIQPVKDANPPYQQDASSNVDTSSAYRTFPVSACLLLVTVLMGALSGSSN